MTHIRPERALSTPAFLAALGLEFIPIRAAALREALHHAPVPAGKRIITGGRSVTRQLSEACLCEWVSLVHWPITELQLRDVLAMTEKSIRKAGVGNQARKRSRRDGWPKAICDYLAGMTDRYLVLEHEPLTLTPGRHLRIGARSLGHDD